jgi:hypothetical protein
MFGQWPLGGVANFGAGAGVLDLVGVELVGAAAAPAMPIAAPPTASAPATVAALSIFEMCMAWSLQWWMLETAAHHYAPRG